MSAAESAGARPLLVLGQSPTFHASRPDQAAAYGPGAASMPNLEAWRRYVTAVAERYGDRIDYQIWNEANIVGYWSGKPKQMAQLTVTGADAIRQVLPKATVVAPSFALRLPSQRRYFERYWALHSKGVDLAGSVDAVAVHLYPLAEDLPEAQVELLQEAREVLAQEGVDLPVWNTEINFGLMGGPLPPQIPAERQRAFMARALLLNAGLGVQRVYWYRWDIGRIANTYLTEEDLVTETLAGTAFDVVRQWLEGFRAEACGRADGEPGVWTCATRKGNQERTFWWKPKGRPAHVGVDGAQSWARLDGTSQKCGATCRVPVGEEPVMVVSRG